MRKRLLARFTERGMLLQPSALDLMLRQPDPEGFADGLLAALPAGRLLLTVEDVQRFQQLDSGTPPAAPGGPAPSPPPRRPAPGFPKGEKGGQAVPGVPKGGEQGQPVPGVREGEGSVLPVPGIPNGEGSVLPGPGIPNGEGSVLPVPGIPKGEGSVLPVPGIPKGVERGPPAADLPTGGERDRPAAAGAATACRPPGPHPGIRVMKDVTGNSTCEGHIEDFIRYFNDRMARIKRLLRGRRELNGALPISSVKARRYEREVRTIGMVADVRRTPKGRVIAEIEDETGAIALLLPEEEGRQRMNLMRDEVVGVTGKLAPDGDIIYVQQIVRPDIPMAREPRRAENPVCAAFISDIHVGSKTFLETEWRRFMTWLNGRERRHQDYARRVEHLVISGDVVDGIGVYPDQEEDLAIRDVYQQYQVLAELLKEVPDRIRILMLPGNHDAVRPAEPQPTFPPEITRLFDSRITFAGNPCHFQLEGVEVLAYHGMSIADFISTIPNLSFNTPLEVMKEMLRRRHLAPVFGDKTPIAPENRDWMVIDSIPDIFVTGHVHAAGAENYRGVVLINASTWQSQTDYQRMMNFQPVPCRVSVVDLHSLDWRMIGFNGQQ